MHSPRCIPSPSLDVVTTSGLARGWRGPVAAHWSQIPFAQQPTTMRQRFSSPVPFESSDHFDAVLPSRIPLHEEKDHTDLTLSICAPPSVLADMKSDAELDSLSTSCPVVVFVHGGRFEDGHADEPIYRGDSFGRDGVVFVSINYRKRFDGFLPLIEPVEADAPPQEEFRGAEDLLCALRWVRHNISQFGGDPENITLMGQSAGAGLAAYVLTLPVVQEESLIQRAVLMSPGLARRSWKQRYRIAHSILRAVADKHTGKNNGWINRITGTQLNSAYRKFARLYFSDVATGPYPVHAEDIADIPLLVTGLEQEFDQFPLAQWADRKQATGNIGERVAARGVQALANRVLRAPKGSVSPEDSTGRVIGNSTILRFVSQILERPRSSSASAPQWALFYRGGAQQDGSRYVPIAQHCADLPLIFDALSSNPGFAELFCGPHSQQALQPLADVLHRQIIGFTRGSDLPWEPYVAGQDRAFRVVNLGSADMTTEQDSLEHIRKNFPPIPRYKKGS